VAQMTHNEACDTGTDNIYHRQHVRWVAQITHHESENAEMDCITSNTYDQWP